MSFDWQTAAVLAIVAAACAYLARAAWQTVVRRKAAACGGCDNCPASAQNQAPEMVSLGQLAESVRPIASGENGRATQD